MNDPNMPITARTARMKNTRQGFTLIELLTVITLSAIITGLVITTLASLFRFDKNVNQHVETRDELRRFSATLRADLHQATSFQGNNEKLTLQIEHPDPKTVRYQVEAGHWLRFTDQQDQPTISTVYNLDESLQYRCETTTATAGDRVEISFTTTTPIETSTEASTEKAANKKALSLPISQSTIITTLGRDYDYFIP